VDAGFCFFFVGNNEVVFFRSGAVLPPAGGGAQLLYELMRPNQTKLAKTNQPVTKSNTKTQQHDSLCWLMFSSYFIACFFIIELCKWAFFPFI